CFPTRRAGSSKATRTTMIDGTMESRLWRRNEMGRRNLGFSPPPPPRHPPPLLPRLRLPLHLRHSPPPPRPSSAPRARPAPSIRLNAPFWHSSAPRIRCIKSHISTACTTSRLVRALPQSFINSHPFHFLYT